MSFDEKWKSYYYNHENIWAEIFKENIANRLKFTNIQKKEIFWLIKNHIRLFVIPEMKKLKARKFMLNPFFEKLLIIWDVDKKWRIPRKEKEFEKICTIYKNFKILLKNKKFLNWKEIMEKYPNLE